MKNDANSKSFRRNKVIEEMAPQRRAEALASTQNDELGNISDVLKENQAAAEMTAEAIEQKGNQIISAVSAGNKGIADVQAGIELAAEGIERVARNTQETTGAARAISIKLSKLSDMLSDKLGASVSRGPSQESTTLQAIQESLPLKVEEPKLQELIEKMLPQHPIPGDAPFLPHPDDDKPSEPNDSKEGKEKFEFNFSDKLDALTKVSKQGFNKVVSVSDSIASMLFKYTVTAAAQAAKFAASIFALVLGIDMIRVYFQYFMKKFDENWSAFDEKFKEWGPLLTSILTMSKNVMEMFKEGNWLKLGESILVGMTKVTAELANLLFLGLGKLTAAILRAIGKDELADDVEGNSLQNYQQKTGSSLDEKDQTTLAKYQDRQEQKKFEGKKIAEKQFKGKDAGLKEAEKYGSVSKETAEEIRAGKIDDSYMNMPEEKRLEVIKKRNDAQASIIRLTKKAEGLQAPTETDIKNAKEEYAEVQAKLNDPELSKAPTDLNTTQLLEKLNKSLEKFDTKVKPVPVEQTPDAQQAKRVDEGIKAKEAAKANNTQTPQAVMNQQVNVNKSSKTQYNMPPQSSTPAPGMHRSVSVS